jgi:hypothetical protein
MKSRSSDWKSKNELAVGNGATFEELIASVGDKKFQIVAPWGEYSFEVDGREITRISKVKNRRRVFRSFAKTAAHCLQHQMPHG